MTGLDGKFALLKIVRAPAVRYTQKTTNANSFKSAVADLKAYAREQLASAFAPVTAQQLAFA